MTKPESTIVATAVLSLCALTACTPHQKESAGGEQTIPSNAAPSTARAAVETPSAAHSPQDALSFVSARLVETKLGSYRSWTPSDVELAMNRWSWSERDRDLFREDVVERYTVEARQLIVPVTVDGPAITFECLVTKCIHVKVLRGSDHQQEWVEERRPVNTWHFRSADDALRVANAMNTALRAAGASAAKF